MITYSFNVNNCNLGNISTFVYKFEATDVAPIIFNNIKNTIKYYRVLVLLMEIKLNVDSRTMIILMVGLDGSGKTTILCPLKRGDIVGMIPITGFNVERVEHKNISFTVCDVGWYYYQNKQGIMFVVDSNESERLVDSSGGDNSAKEELNRTLVENESRDATLLVFTNTQDLLSATSVNEVTERLGLNQLRNKKKQNQ